MRNANLIQNKKEEHLTAEQWNKKYPVGTKVNLLNDFGKTEETITRSEAWSINKNTHLILVEGRSGGYDLDRITPR